MARATEPPAVVKGRPNPQSPAKEGERPLFRYRLGEGSAAASPPVRVPAAPSRIPKSSPAGERPLIRMPTRARPASQYPEPRQRELDLHEPLAAPPQAPPRLREEPLSPPRVSREILFSRLLAGIIDLMLPAVTGLLFAFSGAWFLNFDFFSNRSLHIGAAFGLSFFYLNSIFFLGVAGRTPGMFLTDLELVGEDFKEASPGALVLRTALFLPLAATGVGLLWSLFDPGCRCLHDLLSGTRVVPGSDSERAPPPHSGL